MKKHHIVLIVIIILASILRLYALGKYPSGLNADEAAIGYNAYSLLTTGKDEHGSSWPLVFKSFGDYKPGGYFYLVLPFVKVLGLNIWAVRLPSAILGILSVYLIYLLAGEITRLSKFQISPARIAAQNVAGGNYKFQITAALLLCISPWHLHFSRGGWEANVATTMLLAGVWLFLKSLRRPTLIFLSLFLFILSMYTYQSTRLIAPLLGLGLAVLFWRRFWPPTREVVISFLLLLLLLLPLVKITLSPTGISRLSGVGLTADTGPIWRVNELRGQHQSLSDPVSQILHNKFAAYAMLLGKNYLDHFDGNFLFISGDTIQRSKVPETGQLYLIELPFLLVGLWILVRSGGKGSAVVLFWLVIAPLAAALTFQTPHALRAQNMIIPLTLITSAGLSFVIDWFRRQTDIYLPSTVHRLPTMVYCLLSIVYFWSFTRYLHQYYIHYPQTYPAAWEYGFDQVASRVIPLLSKYDHIFITDTYDQPYIEMLFFLKYPPEIFQREVVLTSRDRYGFSTVRSFGKFQFQPVVWDQLKDIPNALVIGTPDQILPYTVAFDSVLFPNGQPAFEFAQTGPKI